MALPIKEPFPEIPGETGGQRSMEHPYHISEPIAHEGVIGVNTKPNLLLPLQ